MKTWAGFVAMSVGMAVLDIQIVASSLPEIQAALQIPLDRLGWVQTALPLGRDGGHPAHRLDYARLVDAGCLHRLRSRIHRVERGVRGRQRVLVAGCGACRPRVF